MDSINHHHPLTATLGRRPPGCVPAAPFPLNRLTSRPRSSNRSTARVLQIYEFLRLAGGRGVLLAGVRGGLEVCAALVQEGGGGILCRRPRRAVVGHRAVQYRHLQLRHRRFCDAGARVRAGGQLAVVDELDRLDAAGGDRVGAAVAANADCHHRRADLPALRRHAGVGGAQGLCLRLLLRVRRPDHRLHHRLLCQDHRAALPADHHAGAADLRRHHGRLYDVRRVARGGLCRCGAVRDHDHRLHGVFPAGRLAPRRLAGHTATRAGDSADRPGANAPDPGHWGADAAGAVFAGLVLRRARPRRAKG